MLPPIISTTPNSPTVWAKVKIEAVRKPGAASGTATVKKASSGQARRVGATSSGRSPTASKAVCSGCTMSGKAKNTEATTKPYQVKGSGPMPSVWVSCPTGPFGPIASSK